LFIVQALNSDLGYAFVPHASTSPKPLEKGANFENVAKKVTVYGRQWTLAIVDEAHNFRNINQTFHAAQSLRSMADGFVAMTATPVQTRPLVSRNTDELHGLIDYDYGCLTGHLEYRYGTWTGSLPP
jgi:superfamily II DNA or RNA helicase